MTGKRIHVLLVEDEEAQAEAIRRAFESQGEEFSLTVASSLKEARAHTAEFSPDLVITDLTLPDGRGIELLPAGNDEASLPFVVMASHGGEQEAAEAMKRGAMDYVVKSEETLADMPHITGRALREWEHVVERKQAEEELRTHKTTCDQELRESEKKYRTLLENLPQKIFHKDKDSVYVSCNRNYADDLGIEPEDIAGMTDYDFYPTELAEKYRADDRRIMDRGETEEIVESYIRNGEQLVVQTVKTPLRDEDGNVVGVLGIFWDITDRQLAEHDRARLAEIIKQAAEIVVVTDLEGRIEYVNPAFEQATGYGSGEVVGQDTRILLADRDNEAVVQEIRGALGRGESCCTQVATKKKDGSVFHVQVRISPVRDSSGKVISVVGIGRDVTEQLALESQLRQAQKLESVGQLAAGIAHEINTPMQYVGDNTRFLQESLGGILASVNMEAELVAAARKGKLTDELLTEVEKALRETDLAYLSVEIPRAIEQSLDGIERVTRIVRAMKDFSHPGAEGKVAANINRAIESTITVSRNEWKYVVDLVADLDPSIPPIPCFLGELNQVMLNLITNAVDAVREKLGDSPSEKGRITVTTKQDDKWVEIRVSDTGTGIPEETRGRVFDPFFTTKEVGKGTGQGLSIAHSVVVDKHGGTITFETETGIGTTFIVRLPVCPDESEEECREESTVAGREGA